MKKIINAVSSWMVILGSAAIILSGCSSSKTATVKSVPGEKEVLRFCYGPEFNSTKENFRASATGESIDAGMSEKEALTEVRSKLAAQISVLVKTVTDNYGKAAKLNQNEQVMKRYETLTREVVIQKLSGTMEICNRQTKNEAGSYKTYVAMELGGNDLLTAINDRLSHDEMLQVDYNYNLFKKTFDEEMDKFEANH